MTEMQNRLVETSWRTCFLCSEKLEDMKKLKFHLLLKHPKSHVCLFCIEKKGWSNEFPSQVSYNEHYQDNHSGVIEERAEKRLVEKKIGKQQALEIREEMKRTKTAKKEVGTLLRRMKDPKCCKHCEDFPVFESGYERDKHLISNHNYDFCKICKLIGPAFAIVVHIAQCHQKQLCHLCGSQSPIFTNLSKVRAHIEKNHGGGSCPKYFCPTCENLPLPDLQTFTEHFESKHNRGGVGLRLLKRKRNLRNQESNQDILNPISGLKNENHKNCYILSVLHLLAQTNLPRLLKKCETPGNCTTHGSCLLSDFFTQYENCSTFYPHRIIENFRSFGVVEFPFVLIDLIRVFLQSAVTSTSINQENSQIANEYRTIVEWKFECQACHRFVKTRLKDFVLKIHANEPNSFESHLKDFLCNKICTCGASCKIEPNIKQAGDFIFVEVDRCKNAFMGSEEFEVSLYSLKLHRNYNLFGESYQVFATINLNLDYSEGGHYVCNLLIGNDEVMKIHEDNIEKLTTWPAFDNDALIVALRKNKVIKEVTNDVDVSDSSNASVIDAVHSNASELYDANKNQNESENTFRAAPECNGMVAGLHHPVSEHERENKTENPHQSYARQVSFLKPSREKSPPAANKKPESLCSEVNVQRKDSKANMILVGDSMRLYLNDDRHIVQKYRDEYFKKVEDRMYNEMESIKDVSLKSLGGQVLTSKVYRIQSLSGSKKRRKKLSKLDSGMIDNDIKGDDVENELSLRLNIPEEVGILDMAI